MPRASQQDTLSVNRTEIIEFPSGETEIRRLIRKGDWNRLKRNIDNIPSEVKGLQIASSVLFGFGGASALSFFLVCFSPDASPWLFSIFLCFTVFSIVIASILLAVNNRLREFKVDYIKAVIKKDMEDIEGSFEREQEAEGEGELEVYVTEAPSPGAE